MKTAVDTILVGKERTYNRRFLQMCGHYLVHPVACTRPWAGEGAGREPRSGWCGSASSRPRLRVTSYEEFNPLLLDKAVAYARAHRHPEFRDQTIWEAFEAERGSLVPYAGRFDGVHAVTASVSKTCLVRFDTNKYSVMASAVGRPVEIRAYADRIELRQDGRMVGEHPRNFGRDQTVYDPWHYVPMLARKPGALRNGAPFKDWVLPAGIARPLAKYIDDFSFAEPASMRRWCTIWPTALPGARAQHRADRRYRYRQDPPGHRHCSRLHPQWNSRG